MSIQASSTLSNLYHVLAECLSEPLDWFANRGQDWELYELAQVVSDELAYPPLEKAVVELGTIPSESPAQREKRYRNLVSGSSTEPLPIYESMALEGRLHGATTFHVWTIYRTAGLQIFGTELPDHVSIELAFLSYLVQQELDAPENRAKWAKVRREFVKSHAAKWLPSLGRSIAKTHDPVYRPIGLLLTALIQAETIPAFKKQNKQLNALPLVENSAMCTLCGFCAQVCPTQALIVHESRDLTSLQVIDSKCVSCKKCVRICPETIMQLENSETVPGIRSLVTSSRDRCPGCDTPTVSHAEVQAIANQLGEHPRWLDYCSDCRIVFMKELR